MSAPSAVGATPATSPWVKRLAALVLVVALLAAVRFLPIERWLLDLVAWVRGAGTQGIVVFATLSIIVFNLAVDLLYSVIDPRIRLT